MVREKQQLLFNYSRMNGWGRKRAHKKGFFIRLFFVCTETPTINAARIAKRYLNGGHEVPISKVVDRYFKSLQNAQSAIKFVDRAYVYDNSVEDRLPLLCYTEPRMEK